MGRSSWKVLRAKSRAKPLPAAGGSGCPQLLPQELPKCAPKSTGGEGRHVLGPGWGGTPRLCSTPQVQGAQGHMRAGIKRSTHLLVSH